MCLTLVCSQVRETQHRADLSSLRCRHDEARRHRQEKAHRRRSHGAPAVVLSLSVLQFLILNHAGSKILLSFFDYTVSTILLTRLLLSSLCRPAFGGGSRSTQRHSARTPSRCRATTTSASPASTPAANAPDSPRFPPTNSRGPPLLP